MLFFWGWRRVLAATPDFAELRLLMLGAAIVVPVVTVSWILHNRGIHRRKGPRRHVAAAKVEYRVDFNGREIVADFRALAPARRVDIVVEGTRKEYRLDAAEAAGAATLPVFRDAGTPAGRQAAASDVESRAAAESGGADGAAELSSSGERDSPAAP